jgi:TetR/AcrR family transcriptional repressor of nem operon
MESLREAFREIEETLVRAAEQAPLGEAWKAIVKTYLRPELCEHPEHGCPLPALAPELARADKGMKPRIVAELVNYKSQMLPFMPGRRTVDKERAFFAIFSTMIGAVEIARMLPDPAMRGKVLTSARDFSLAQLLTSSTMMPEECLWHILRIAGSHAQFGSTPDCRL